MTTRTTPLSTLDRPSVVRAIRTRKRRLAATLVLTVTVWVGGVGSAIAGGVATAGGTADIVACEDVSPSFPADTRLAFNEALIERLRTHVAAPAPKIRTGASTRRGVNVVVRPIGKASYAAANSFEVRLDPLPRSTPLRDDESVDATLARLRTTKERTARMASNETRIEQFANGLRSWDPPFRRGSDITGCLLAAADLLGRRSPQLYLVTDLLATTPPPATTSMPLTGVDVTVIQTCREVVACEALRVEWQDHLSALGAKHVRFARPEQITDVVALPR